MKQIDSLQFGQANWSLLKTESTPNGSIKEWQDGSQDLYSLTFFAQPDPPPVDILTPSREKAALAIRPLARELAKATQAGLIDADVVVLAGQRCMRMVLKYPQSPAGFSYVGSYAFYLEGVAYTLKIQANESSPTGLRESVVALKMGIDLQPGFFNSLRRLIKKPAIAWFTDPYDPDYAGPILRTQSDDLNWDPTFPDHPLSRLRRAMKRIEAEARFVETTGA